MACTIGQDVTIAVRVKRTRLISPERLRTNSRCYPLAKRAATEHSPEYGSKRGNLVAPLCFVEA
jgi:hypothetical protein